MFDLLQLFAQRRQFGARLLRQGLQAQDFVRRCLTQSHAPVCQGQLFFLCAQDGGGGFHLRGKPRAGDGGGGNVAGQSQACGLHFKLAVVSAGGQRFERAAIAASPIEVVLHPHAGVVQIESPRVIGLPQCAKVETLALGTQPGIDLRIQRRTGLSGVEFLCLG